MADPGAAKRVRTPGAHGKQSDHNKVACVDPLTHNSSLEGWGRNYQLLLTRKGGTRSLCHHVPQSHTPMAIGGEGVRTQYCPLLTLFVGS